MADLIFPIQSNGESESVGTFSTLLESFSGDNYGYFYNASPYTLRIRLYGSDNITVSYYQAEHTLFDNLDSDDDFDSSATPVFEYSGDHVAKLAPYTFYFVHANSSGSHSLGIGQNSGSHVPVWKAHGTSSPTNEKNMLIWIDRGTNLLPSKPATS